jgi:hypothetical protein
MMIMRRIFSDEIASVPVERYQHFGAACYVPSASLFYSEGKGRGFLRNIDTVI